MEYEQKVRKKVWEIFGNSKKVTTFALAIEREIIDAKDGEEHLLKNHYK